MTTRPLDPRQAAFANAIGRLLADMVWDEITSGTDAAKKNGVPHDHEEHAVRKEQNDARETTRPAA